MPFRCKSARVSVGLIIVLSILLAGCGNSATSTPTLAPSVVPAIPTYPANDFVIGKDEQEITFTAGKDKIFSTILIPAGKTGKLPAVLLISGSGPTDRDGNNPLIKGKIDSHANLARILAEQGVISLRYDKIGTGKTGLGSFATNPTEIGFDTYIDTAMAAYEQLKARPEVDPQRIMILGHSEGGLIALVVADKLKGSNGIKALVLAMPLSKGYLDTIRAQLTEQYSQAVKLGQVTQAQADTALAELDQVIKSLVDTGKQPTVIKELALKNLFVPTNEKFFGQVAKYDPLKIAAGLSTTLPVLLFCGQVDSQVPCADVQGLTQAFQKAGNSKATLIELPKTNHVFKEVIGTPNPTTDYGNPDLKFSTEATNQLVNFVKNNL